LPELQSIEIDVDVYKRIEAERSSFGETHNTLLRRLLAIDAAPKRPREASGPGATVGTRPWAGKGVVLPHASQVRMEYNGRVHTGVIQDGRWVVEGHRYSSPSAAASGVARTKGGKQTSLDGWIYWLAKAPGSADFVRLSELRSNGLPKPRPRNSSMEHAMIDLPPESSVIVELEAFLAKQSRPVSPDEGYRELADLFQLTSEQRQRPTSDGKEPHWNNRVRFAMRKLRDAGKIDEGAGHGRWALKRTS
jgi:hypothetical protein